MDPRKNPFAPGAGNPPPELAGRSAILEEIDVALARVRDGLHDRGQLLLGLRGVGKTVLLNEIERLATENGYVTAVLEAPAEGKLAALLVPRLRGLLVQLSMTAKAKAAAREGLGVLRAFASAFKVKIGDAEFGVAAANGKADSGNLETDLPDLFLAIGAAAKAADKAAALLIDEVQYLSKAELSALIVAVHRVNQKKLPLMLFGAGLPQLAGLAGDAKSYAERLFRFPGIGALSPDAAREAIVKPIRAQGADITEEAVDLIVRTTDGYAYFVQEWGFHSWLVAKASPITADDVQTATARAMSRLDNDFFRVRLDRLTPREKDYLRAMAELGPGPHRSGDIATHLGIEVTGAGFLRKALTVKGMIFSPQYGLTAFTVPMFDVFLRRSMPGWVPSSVATGNDDDHAREAP